MIIRKATLDDLGSVVRIYKATLNKMVNPHKIFKIYIKKGNCFVIEDTEIRGAMTFEINRMLSPYSKEYGKQKYLWLEQLVIDPEYQGQGLGSKLMEHTIKQSDLQKRFVCDVYLAEYYKRFGFIVYRIVSINKREQALMISEG